MDWQSFKQTSLFFLSIAVQCILAVIMPLTTVYLAKIIENLTWSITIAIGILVLACGLFIFNNIPIDWPIRSGSIKKKIYNWLNVAGFSLKNDSHENLRFKITATDPQNSKFIFINSKKDNPSKIQVAIIINFKGDGREILDKLNKDEQFEFLHYLRSEVLRFGIFYRGIKWPLESFTLSHVFYIDRSTKSADFYNDIDKIRGGFNYIANISNIWLHKKRITSINS